MSVNLKFACSRKHLQSDKVPYWGKPTINKFVVIYDGFSAIEHNSNADQDAFAEF